MSVPKVAIVLGSDSDLPVMKGTAQLLESFGIAYEIIISSAHRVTDKTVDYAKSAESRGIEVIIAGAGMAAHLPGVIAAVTPVPVIGVPLESGALKGVDALYAIVQMPTGIPVATVAINGAKNAAVLAAQILGVKYPEIRDKIKGYKAKLAEEVNEKDKALQELGIDGYLAAKNR